MSDRSFKRFIFILIGVLTLLTIAHMIYASYAYEHSSIIAFISKEIW